MRRGELLEKLEHGGLLEQLQPVYGADAPGAALRLRELMEEFADTFPCTPDSDTYLFSAPGRTELGGNHTDHQNGHGLAASVDLDTIACVVPNDSGLIRIKSRHHTMAVVELADLSLHEEEIGKSVALVRGVAGRIQAMGHTIRGFDAYTTTRVLRGSGLSSSAAFEVLTANIINHLCCSGALSATEMAQIGQFAENVYFGKPCGLLDQLACATGGVVSMDFADPEAPVVKSVDVDLASRGYALVIVDSRASHSDLTDYYASIPREMKAVAAFFGKEVLSQVDYEQFRRSLPALRGACGDRAVMRAFHFFRDDRRVLEQHAALERGDWAEYLRLVDLSGRSSFMYLQNVSTHADPKEQPLALLLAAAEDLLEGQGACRVHGGGFAGTIQAYVPLEKLESFVAGMESITGQGTCHVLQFRPVGTARLI